MVPAVASTGGWIESLRKIYPPLLTVAQYCQIRNCCPASAWYALFAPKGTPRPITDKLSDALDRALADDTVRKRFIDLGCDIPDKAGSGREPLAALMKRDIALWTPIIKAANVKGE